MLAPLPDPMPSELAPALERVRWIGPRVGLDGLPRFEIAYDDSGAVTLFREHLGAEPDMTPALLDSIEHLPSAAYCVPFLDAHLQRTFIDALAARGCLTIASTYGKAARNDTELVRSTLAVADLSFCNADEEGVLFGGHAFTGVEAGHVRVVTRGARGATVWQGDHRTDIAGQRVEVLDPTGAGDTFCGTAVARILMGDHPVEAARRGNAAAAEMVTAVGPAALWAPGPSPVPTEDPRVVVDPDRVDRMADLLTRLPDLEAFDFTGELLPPVGDPDAIAWFTAATLLQFGFWYERDGRWVGSMIAEIGGRTRKGSDYLWAAYQRLALSDRNAVHPETQTLMTPELWHTVAADDHGVDPFPEPRLFSDAAASYGRTMSSLGVTADDLIDAANSAARPMQALLTLLDHVGGYREDPLRKKSALLGVILRQRPEHVLRTPPLDDDAPPIVDYHVQRTALRTGMVVVDDALLSDALGDRRVISADDEAAVRRAAFAAVQRLATTSRRSMGAVDWFLFQMRHRCPEIGTPDCRACPADSGCAHRTELFQPVFRTTAY